MGLDLIAIGVATVFILLGMWRGLIRSGLGLVSLVLGYVNAVVAATHLGPILAARFDLNPLLATPIMGTFGFLGTIITLSILTAPLRRADRERARAAGRDLLDRVGGGLLGGARGALVIVLLALLASWLDVAREMTNDPRLAAVPDTEESRVAGAASLAIESAIGTALGGNPGRVAGRILARPSTSLRALQAVTSDPSLRALQSDSVFWMYVEQGQAHNAVYRPAFQALTQNGELRQQLADLGAIDAEAADSPEAFRSQMLEALEQVGPRLQALRADPELQELANDPAVLAQLEAGDPWALLADTRVYRIASRIAEGH
ncbi:MAG: CvpA family protein [bacterium]|nr:CvpA family protein [bacterium]MCP5065780.1 CvpA family protein [bacterium]